MSGHAQREHAILSASGASRWMACSPSAQLEEQYEEQSSVFAEEGTAAHELAEDYLKREVGEIAKGTFTRRLNKMKKNNEHYSQAMFDYVENYATIVMEHISDLKKHSSDVLVLLEERLDFSRWVPQGFGTGDVVLVAEETLEVIDLKYGKGVAVSAENNPQMRLYALGALNQFEMLYDIHKVRMTIVQPRLDSVSTDEIDAADLLKWADETVKPKADKAIEGEGQFQAGSHCRFCKAKSECRARAEANLEMAKFDFQDPPLLSHEEIAEILPKADELQKWAKDIQSHALDQAERHGVKYPGYKLVEGRSNRKYTDEKAVIKTLKDNGVSEEDIFEKKVRGITKMEKAIGKKPFSEYLADYVIKPAGKPTLVPESDKRPEINSIDSAKADFS
ncbi:DUF2800 domain-containing protein [Halobacillus karajensis]|uniref:DUF2800 domain-containing protein n=1 Tax=Halobacillus karajensis TaxID=195088 RepID=UPI00045CF643|nr:DUF2800 domain-containing protein [Halobacillus karajensis]CDQ17969.1 PD-(D/E)XK nuclease superfamily protein [Halobacillus karajensis]